MNIVMVLILMGVVQRYLIRVFGKFVINILGSFLAKKGGLRTNRTFYDGKTSNIVLSFFNNRIVP